MLKSYRKTIDKIDEDIKELVLKRFDILQDIADYKKQHHLKVSDASRETELIINLTKDIKDPKIKKLYTAYLEHMLLLSKEYQKDIMKNDDNDDKE